MGIVTACVLQDSTVGFDTEATLAKAEALIAEAARIGARIAVLPEGFVGGYPKGADFRTSSGRVHRKDARVSPLLRGCNRCSGSRNGATGPRRAHATCCWSPG